MPHRLELLPAMRCRDSDRCFDAGMRGLRRPSAAVVGHSAPRIQGCCNHRHPRRQGLANAQGKRLGFGGMNKQVEPFEKPAQIRVRNRGCECHAITQAERPRQ
jgi:hypothetical protein